MGLTLLQCVARIFLNYHYGKERNQMKLEMRIQNGKKYCHSSVRLFLTPVLTCTCSATVTSTKNMYNTKKVRTSKHEVFLPPPQSNSYSKLISFPMLKLSQLPPLFGGGFTFYYTSHVIKWFILHVHCARPLNGFENGSNLAENRIEYILLTSWDGNSVFSSANQAWPGSQKLVNHKSRKQ